ncbi:indoleamine 2,3-dioxygenase 2-like isoform 5-T5 [Acridotheres tristis]
MESSDGTEEPPLPLALSRFQVSEEFGFLLPDPLTELPAPYSPWMDLARELPQLITGHQLRSRVHQMPQLSTQHLQGREELHLAHLVLSFITMGYVWQEGEEGTVQVKARSCPEISLSPTGRCPRPWASRPSSAMQTLCWPTGGGRTPMGLWKLNYVDPEVFYSVIRIFLSGWKDNPAMPHGLIYEGVSPEPLAFSGGSAAQSSVLHAFDELLGICHRHDTAAFLHRMRDYMPPAHRAFVQELRAAVSVRQCVLAAGDARLRAAFNRCVCALTDFRSQHIAIVTKYIAIAATKARARRAEPSASAGPSAGKPPAALEAKGTGGSQIFSFLKSIRDSTREGLISA